MREPGGRLLLTYYGDDFTGSTDVMEALASSGVRTVLFTRRPSAAVMSTFADYEAVGLAGSSRSQTTAWMDQHLAADLAWLKSLDGQFCHYKVCSTFDSSPSVGSIGKALEIGRDVFAQTTVPLVVGAPQLKRYTVFGHLFAGYQGTVYRIDRHPVMAKHPVTPMEESDLRRHLMRQTTLPVRLVGLDVWARPDADMCADEIIDAGPGIVLLDVADPATQLAAGTQILRARDRLGPFIAGSSGVEYALLRALTQVRGVAGSASFAPIEPVDRLLVVSGSVSPTSERQIRHAVAHGFAAVAADPLRIATGADEEERATREALVHFVAGRSVIVHTALGTDSDRGAELDGTPGARHQIGKSLGRIAARLVAQAGLKRLVIAGGDTSSHALNQLSIYALTTRLPLPATPGSPLCLAHSDTSAFHHLEIALKGGQIGGDDYFSALKDARL